MQERFIVAKNKRNDRNAWPYVIIDTRLGRDGTLTAKAVDEFTAAIVVGALNRDWDLAVSAPPKRAE